MNNPPIFLTGFSGTGKSTLGQALSFKTGRVFFDLDKEIELLGGAKIPTLMEKLGEPKFRELEAQILSSLALTANSVISLGGGALMSPTNRQRVLEKGCLFYLESSVDRIISNLNNDSTIRPLIKTGSRSEIEELLDQRVPGYEKAHFKLKMDDEDLQTACKRVEGILRKMAGTTDTQLKFTSDLVGDVVRAAQHARATRVAIICDVRFKALANRMSREVEGSFVILVKGQERSKKIKELDRLIGQFVRHGMDRRSLVVALGGGVIGDLSGFVASVYMRGISWISVPTTLLGMVDSGYGGKTALNHKLLKNSLGTFHRPSLLLVDVQFLSTLSKRDLISGAAEILKYGLLYQPSLFWRVTPVEVSRWKVRPKRALPFIRSCLRHKKNVVSHDLLDRTGVRQALNLGHTLGHALEAATKYKFYRHGEAVLMGLEFAIRVSAIHELLHRGTANRLKEHLVEFRIPKARRPVSYQEIWESMTMDKKSEGGTVNMVLLKGIKKPVTQRPVSSADALLALIEMSQRWGLSLK